MAPRRPKNTKNSRSEDSSKRGSRGSHSSGGDRNGRRPDRRSDRRGDQEAPAIDEQAVLRALATLPGGGTTAQVARVLGFGGDGARALGAHFRNMVTNGLILEVRPGRYQPSGSGGEHSAVIEGDEDGGLTARLPDGEVHPVDRNMTIGARAGDVCQVMLAEDGHALVTRILRRTGRTVVGSVNFRPQGMVFVPDNRREGELPVLSVPSDFERTYQAGSRVRGTLNIDSDGEAGVVVDGVLDTSSPEVADFTYVKLVHDLPGEFPAEVEKEAAAFKDRLPVGNREDLSEEFIFTIDPATAKDFDDAISLKTLDDGAWEVGVHIADVSHYVREGTALNEEASARATSIYLINRVIPMLPEVLSNGLCSLVPNKDRYSLSVFMKLDRHLRLVDTRLAESIIHSKQRLSYEQAMGILEGDDQGYSEELTSIIRSCGKITQGLRAARERAGALNLYSVEHRFTLDVEGNPVEVKQESTDASHQLIEEFMLLANRAVATWLEKQGFPCTYRVHAPPDGDKMEQFAQILEAYGIDSTGFADRFGLQRLLKRLEQEPRAARLVLNFMCLRSFKKAVYAVENIGHYALAFESYCHFTSPIRRYPDLLVHRLVKRALKLKEYAKVEMRLDYLDALARQSSGLEQRAEQAERTLHSRKCARFLAQRIGDGFPAVVTGASHGGVFVQLLETGMEGFLPIRELGDDYYTYEPERFALVGSRSGRVFGPGTEIDVLVSSVDIDRSDVIFTLDRHAKPGASAEKNEVSGVGQSITADLARLSSRSSGKKAKSGGSKGPSKMGKADRGKRPENDGRDSKKKPQRSKRR